MVSNEEISPLVEETHKLLPAQYSKALVYEDEGLDAPQCLVDKARLERAQGQRCA